MTNVRRSSPLGELVSLRQAMDRVFEDSFVRPRGWVTSSSRNGSKPLAPGETSAGMATAAGA